MAELVRPPDPLLGTTIDGTYVIERKLGTGGMGTVYLATEVKTDRPIALKIMHPQLVDEAMLERFTREADVARRLDHPNIVRVVAHGQDATGPLYIAMELVEGDDLSVVIRRDGPLSVHRAIALGIQCAEALAYAHAQGVVHRDIKPENIMLSRASGRESVKLLDFGLARVIDSKSFLTTTGKVLGSPAYMSIEQWSGDRSIDGRTDVYSLGCVLYIALTGRLPYRASHPLAYLEALRTKTPDPPSARRPELAEIEGLDALVMRCLQRHRDDRFPDAAALATALHAVHDQTRALATTARDALSPSEAGGSSEPRPTHTESSEAKRNPWPTLAALAAVGGVLVFAVGDPSSTPDAAEPTQSPSAVADAEPALAEPGDRDSQPLAATSTPEGVVASSAVVDASTAAARDRMPEPSGPTEPAPLQIVVETEPTGAEIIVDGEARGSTPGPIDIGPDATVQLEVRRRGRTTRRTLTWAEASALPDGRLVLALPDDASGKAKSSRRPPKREPPPPPPAAEPEPEPTPTPKPRTELTKLPIE